MKPSQLHQPNPIARLPVELVRTILSALPNPASLQAAISSSSLFYRAFLEAEREISEEVLLNQIDVCVLPEAIAAFESSRLRPHHAGPKSLEAIEDFVAQNLHQRPVPTSSWSLRKALQFGQLHFSVAGLANKFAEEALANPPLDRSKPIVAFQERFRIERALYRFEVYCNLFRERSRLKSVVHEEQKRMFFSNFAPWENEQLGCIHDFLFRAVSPAFNEIAEHDIAWGAFNVEYGHTLDSEYIQTVLSFGLKKLHQIAVAETYDERHKLLYSGHFPRANFSFLYEWLVSTNVPNDDVIIDQLDRENVHLHVKPMFADPDPGPFDVWQWAHLEETWRNWVYQKDRRELRRWGYVMWDRSRLEAIGIFEKPWEDTDEWRRDLEEEEIARQRAYLQNSWEEREAIYRSGGRGWWSFGDESKVQWQCRDGDEGGSGSRAPGRQGPSVPNLPEPTSLQQAREMLSMTKLPPSVK